MGRTPKDIDLFDGEIECHPHEPDDHGGGFPCITINDTIYDEKELDRVIKGLEKRRKWLSWETKRKYVRSGESGVK